MFAIDPTPGEYVLAHQEWKPYHSLDDGESPNIKWLTVATFNVWFGADYFNERCQAVLALLESCRPDLIALQEVTPDFLQQVLHTPWVQAEYRISDIYGDSVDPYGVLILSRLPIREWQFFALPSVMGRHLVTARALLNATVTTFASVHLESTSYAAPTRAKQLARIFPLLATEQHVILSGDFNFCSSWEENRRLDPTYQDVWPLLHQTAPGFTEDTDRNTMRLLVTGKRKQVRFDRLLLRSQPAGWRAETIRLIGTEPISSTMPNIFPSDHFGLLGTFVWQA
ncbi:MAG: endonuclease/exonuclease/phosphatase family protein [Chloroflexales bacterium]|nr:endonuclease/exonuclease/phosphatase family protein [Chloroflexales bacterium]